MPLDVDKERSILDRMTAVQLAEKFAELYGEQTHSRHRTYLVRKILWRLQTIEEGGLSERARRRAEELAAGAELRVMPPTANPPAAFADVPTRAAVATDPRLPPPGASLVREYKGRRCVVRVRADGFEFEGERFASLSAVAKRITGSHCNGFRFFQLEDRE